MRPPWHFSNQVFHISERIIMMGAGLRSVDPATGLGELLMLQSSLYGY